MLKFLNDNYRNNQKDQVFQLQLVHHLHSFAVKQQQFLQQLCKNLHQVHLDEQLSRLLRKQLAQGRQQLLVFPIYPETL